MGILFSIRMFLGARQIATPRDRCQVIPPVTRRSGHASRQQLTAIGFRGGNFSSPIRLAEIVFRVKLPQHGNLARSRGRIPALTSDGLAAPILRGSNSTRISGNSSAINHVSAAAGRRQRGVRLGCLKVLGKPLPYGRGSATVALISQGLPSHDSQGAVFVSQESPKWLSTRTARQGDNAPCSRA